MVSGGERVALSPGGATVGSPGREPRVPAPDPDSILPTPRFRGTRTMFRTLLCGVIAVTFPSQAFAQNYQRPPKAVTDILDVPPPPALSVSPTSDAILLAQSSRYPSIEEVAAPQLRLAGLRIDPKANGPARSLRIVGLTLVPLPGAKESAVELPKHGKAGFPLW